MNESSDWALITIAALIAGLFNLPGAFQKLRQTCKGVPEGLRSLHAYFSADIALTLEERQKFLDSISQALLEISIDKQIEVVENLLPEVRQRDLVDALESFKCSPQFLQIYLPRRFVRSIAAATSSQAIRL